MTIPKIRALMKERQRLQEFEIVLHGGKVESSSQEAKKAVFLSDLGIMPAQKGEKP